MQILDDFGSEYRRVRKVVRIFQALAPQPRDIKAELVPFLQIVVIEAAEPLRFLALKTVRRIEALTNSSKSDRFKEFVFSVKCLLVRRS